MLEPRTDLQIHMRGGYLEGSRGRFTAKDHFSCINCREHFSSRRELGFHQMKCPYYQFVQPPNEHTPKIYKCVKCGMKFDDKKHLMFHVRRCGYYVDMKRAVTGDTSADDDICPMRDNARDSDIAANNEGNCIGKIVGMNTESKSSTDGSSGSENQHDNEAENYKDEINNSGEVEMKTDIKEGNKLYSRKRKNEAMFSHESSELLKRAKADHNGAPLYRTLVHDLEQESRQNVFDRVSARERPYKCSQCNVKFKYKHKFDFHVKFVHDITTFVTSSHDKDTRENVIEESNLSSLTKAKSGSSTDDQTCSDKWTNETKIQRYGQTNAAGMKTKIGNYPCEFCHLSFRFYSRRERHVKSVHQKQTEQVDFLNIFSCSHCEERFPDKRSLLKHYSHTHLRNGKSQTEKSTHEQFISDLKVGDVMQHLRRNLLCLQDGTGFEKYQMLKSTESRLDVADYLRERDVSTTGSPLKNAGRERTSPRYNDYRNADKSDHDVEKVTRETSARKRKFEVFHYYPKKDNFSEDIRRYNCTQNSPNDPNLDANDAPIDLSLKAKNKEERATPCNTKENKTADDKAITSERALLMEYYKDFLQEYCVNQY